MAAPAECRPDPDTLLARVQGEERLKHRGKLKIFLGYIAGVGKTYEMLKAAHLRQAEGIDVRIGTSIPMAGGRRKPSSKG